MRAARFKPIAPVPEAPAKGPQLVPPRKTVATQASAEAAARADPHPLAAALTIVGIAAIGAITFAGSVLSWVLLRQTGVNWMFQSR
jgi:NAD/NADP transhydrogenase beta subunit